jgi:predicted dehydrogenase
MREIIVALALSLAVGSASAAEKEPPIRFAIFGLTHDHARGFIPKAIGGQDAQLVGIIEPNRELAERYRKRLNLDKSLFFSSLEELLSKTKVQAVATFTSTLDHRRAVELCAPRGIHVMMEKPLAVNMDDARAIQAAAKKGGIQIIVNYETTWYAANQAAYILVRRQHVIGDLRKIVALDGHCGPKELGCDPDFVKWLTDPVQNGGGALMDFGCYGADLMTWMMDGQRPTKVMAVTQQIKPHLYPKVEDEATIVLTYPKAQGIIQASWNWAVSRKDLEIYGTTGYLLATRSDGLRMRKTNGSADSEMSVTPLSGPQADPVAYLAAVVRGQIEPTGPSSLKVNMIVTEILDAARESARTGKQIELAPAAGQ